jgi:SAM-dependent methyltransferase
MPDLPPSPWVRRFSRLITVGGKVLDVASGTGRHACLLADMGYSVEAVDRDANALSALSAVPGITTRTADLESGPWPYGRGLFDGIIVTNYLYRPCFDALVDALAPSGVLIYETFMVGNERLGKPSNPDFLLLPGELLDRLRGRTSVVAFEQGRVNFPKPAVIQRICAVNGEVDLLPV